MSEFIKVYADYFNLGISNNAILLLSFITGRISISEYEHSGQKYIIFKGENDPCKFFSWNKWTYKRALKELTDLKIVTTEYLAGTGNKKAIFADMEQICILYKNAPHNVAKMRQHKEQICTIPFNNNRYSNRSSNRYSTNISDLSNTNSIDGKTEATQKSIPSYDDLLKYSSENNLNFSIQDFLDYYSEKNWLINGKPIKSWKALANSWANKQFVRDSRLFGENSYSFYLSLSPELQKQVDADQASNTRGWIRFETQKAIDEFMAKKITPFIIVQTVNDDISEV